MTEDLFQFCSFYDDLSKHVIHTANGHILLALGISFVGYLSSILYVPNLKASLISLGHLVDQHCVITFSPNDFVVHNLKTGMTIAKGRRNGRMFLLESVHHYLHYCFHSISVMVVTRSISC